MAIELTENAVKNVIRIRETSNSGEVQALRISLVGGGCSGLSYKMTFDTPDPEKDKIFTFGELTVAVDKRSYLLLNGTKIDYEDGLDGNGFVFENPNATKTCGCGTSFTA